MNPKILLIITILTISNIAKGNTVDSISSGKTVNSISLEGYATGSYIIPTNSFLKGNTDNQAIVTPEVRAGFSFSPSTRYGRLYKGVTQGIGLNWNIPLPNSTLGYPAGMFVYQTVRLCSFGHLSAEAGWDFGFTVPWRHFDYYDNPTNTAIGSTVNALLGVNVGASYQLNSHVALKAAINATHYSNGNTKQPNAGLNTIGLRLGVVYTLGDTYSATERTTPLADDYCPGMGYDITVYGATRRRIACDSSGDKIILPGKFGVVGLSFSPMYSFSRYIRAGLSLDMQYDESANIGRHLVDGTYGDDVRFYRQPFYERFAAGLSVHAELKLTFFSINAGIGRNIIARGDLCSFYQSLALKAYVFRGAYLHVGYRLFDFSEPNNLMLGIGYTFGRR